MIALPLPILILQHPQEPSRQDSEVGSAMLLKELVAPCHLTVGLSWRNLSHALKGFSPIESIEELKKPALWATLYLGTRAHSGETEDKPEPGIYYLDKKGNPREANEKNEEPIGGLILLDGTWAQAKTIWWRNAWLLKTKRIHVVPKQKSLYGNLRKEPRPECVSTLEAAAETFSFLGLDPSIEATLKAAFNERLKSARLKHSKKTN